MSNNLWELFSECLDTKYTTVEDGGSFSLRRSGSELYIFFEKSNGEEDWINNLSYHAESYGEMDEAWYCHEGFLRVWKGIKPYLSDAVKSTDVEKFTVTGYSHGAAIALLCHEYIWFHRPDVKLEGYGFGCPRVVWGYPPREDERWQNFTVVRNIDDVVTHLPPRITGYRHVGRLLEIGGFGRYSGIEAHRAENYLYELSR